MALVAASSCGLKVRPWRRAQFCLGQSDFIFADGAWDVCEGDHSLDVMNPWDALTTKIRCRRFGEARPLLCDRTAPSPWQCRDEVFKKSLFVRPLITRADTIP